MWAFKLIWDRLIRPAGQDIIIGRTRDFLRHPDRYMRPDRPDPVTRRGRLGSAYMNRYKNELDMDEPDQEILDGADPLTRETADVDAVSNSDSSDLHNETPFPWEKWEQLPKEEREAEMKEAAKQAAKEDKDETAYAQLDQADPVTGETDDVEAVGNSDTRFIVEIPFWDVAETDIVTEGVGGHFFDTGEGEFNSNPQTLTPINIDSALVTDAYQQQDAPGADLIAGEANQGMDPYQAKEERYEVLA